MPRIHTIDMQRLTPLGQLLAEYMRQQWPRLQTKAELAHYVGVRPSTIDNMMYSAHVPSSRTLNKIAHATGIPATRLYEASAGIWTPAPLAPPVSRDLQQRHQPPRLVEGDAPYAALDEFLRRVQSFSLDEDQRRALIDSVIAAVAPVADHQYWQRRFDEEHDHDHIKTLELPTVPTAPPARSSTTAEPQAESQPAGQLS